MTKKIFTFLSAMLFPILTSPVFAQSKASESFDSWNNQIGNNLTTLSEIINTLLPYTLVLAGLVLLLMLISGGFSLLTAAGNPESVEKGKQRLTAAFMGFIIIFAAYWIIQILQVILGVNILEDSMLPPPR